MSRGGVKASHRSHDFRADVPALQEIIDILIADAIAVFIGTLWRECFQVGSRNFATRRSSAPIARASALTRRLVNPKGAKHRPPHHHI
jgi:hypothetical protein